MALQRIEFNNEGEVGAFNYKKVYNTWKDKPTAILREALRNEGIEMRFNTRSDQRELRQNGGAWIQAVNRTMSKVRVGLMENYGIIKTKDKVPRPLKWSKEDWKMLLETMDTENEVDPFVVWTKERPVWDGEERIDYMLYELYHEHPQAPKDSLTSEFGRWASRFPFIAAIQKAYYYDSWKAEDQIHTKPLFVGDQGIGKSSMIKNILPPEKRWVNQNFVINQSVKKMLEQSKGMVICECAEMAGLTKWNLAVWMAFTTGDRSNERFTWRADPEFLINKCIYIGTTNDLMPIPTAQGGWRRDLPVLLGEAKGAVEPWIVENRDQMWAEAMVRVQNGERAQIPYELRKKAGQHTEQFRRRNDPVEDAVERLPQEFPPTSLTDLMIRAGLINNTEEAIQLHPDTRRAFVNKMLAFGCKYIRVPHPNGKGKSEVSGYMRQGEQKSTE